MSRTQLNINIKPELLKALKQAAIKSGKTTTEFVSDIITEALKQYHSTDTSDSKIIQLEERIRLLEATIGQHPADQKITILTKKEESNCNEFIKGIFEQEIKRKKYKSRMEAWNDLIAYINCFDQWNDMYTLRLKEVLFINDGDPLTIDEIMALSKGDKCPCPIRTGFINWINNGEKGECSCSDQSFPSSKTIFENGPKLLENLYAL